MPKDRDLKEKDPRVPLKILRDLHWQVKKAAVDAGMSLQEFSEKVVAEGLKAMNGKRKSG